ncbi:hypothetical protein [Leucobacter sp. NPDC077196]|uniref:hypothetical protein n=1 Tax=Leucobacter sp. NPDC077196 TaxID=3154959 RepID=UPI0034184ADA
MHLARSLSALLVMAGLMGLAGCAQPDGSDRDGDACAHFSAVTDMAVILSERPRIGAWNELRGDIGETIGMSSDALRPAVVRAQVSFPDTPSSAADEWNAAVQGVAAVCAPVSEAAFAEL